MCKEANQSFAVDKNDIHIYTYQQCLNYFKMLKMMFYSTCCPIIFLTSQILKVHVMSYCAGA